MNVYRTTGIPALSRGHRSGEYWHDLFLLLLRVATLLRWSVQEARWTAAAAYARRSKGVSSTGWRYRSSRRNAVLTTANEKWRRHQPLARTARPNPTQRRLGGL